MAKPKPKASSTPTGQPAAVPPRTRDDGGRQHPWEPEPAGPTPASEEPRAPGAGLAHRRPDRRASARPEARTRVRARDKSPDLEQWGRLVNVAALKVGAARRKTATREQELEAVIGQARAAGADDATLGAWLVAAGLGLEDLPQD